MSKNLDKLFEELLDKLIESIESQLDKQPRLKDLIEIFPYRWLRECKITIHIWDSGKSKFIEFVVLHGKNDNCREFFRNHYKKDLDLEFGKIDFENKEIVLKTKMDPKKMN